MKPSTPRKFRRRNQPPSSAGPSSGGPSNAIPVSDYESDAPDPKTVTSFATSATFGDINVQAVHGAPETISVGALNLKVLQRYWPSIQSCCIAGPPTTVYSWDWERNDWGESLGLGAPFVCDQHPDTSAGQPVPRPCIAILNRKGLENFFFDLSTIIELHQADLKTDHGTKLMIQISLRDPEIPDDVRPWGLLGDAEPMREVYASIEQRVNDMNAARKSAR